MTSEGLGEMFEGDSADMCAGVDGGPSGGSRWKRGTPSATAEIVVHECLGPSHLFHQKPSFTHTNLCKDL